MEALQIYQITQTEYCSLTHYNQSVPAGFPFPAMDYMEDRIDLNKELIKHPLATFLISSEGNSMVNAFIPPKAKLLVDRSVAPKNGDIILAVVNGEFTVKESPTGFPIKVETKGARKTYFTDEKVLYK